MRDLFLLDASIVFLNHGSFGACPRPVFDAYQEWQRQMERNPVEFLGRRSAGLLAESRTALGAYLGARAQDLIYIQNATTGVNIVARSLDLSAGDEIVTTDQEYGACDNAWNHVARARGAKVVRARIPLPFRADEFVERVWSAVGPATRVITVSHITSATALIFPIAELCRRAREAGIPCLVDGAHAPGQIDLDLAAIDADYYVGNCHKWLCAPKGAGFLHVREDRQAVLDAPVISWGYSDDSALLNSLAPFIGQTALERRMQWQGTRDIAAFLAVPAAIAFLQEHAWDAVRAQCHALARGLHDRLVERAGLAPLCAPDDFAQMVAIPVPAMDPAALKTRLIDAFRIEVPVTVHHDQVLVRVSVQGYNTRADLDALEAALASLYGWDSAPSSRTRQ